MSRENLEMLQEHIGYAHRSVNDAQFQFGQAAMFVSAQLDQNGDMRSSIEDKLSCARTKVEDAMLLLGKAERLVSVMEESAEDGLHRTTLNMDVVKAVPQQPQVQSSLTDQLAALEVLASRFGLYDAHEYLRFRVKRA